MIKYSEKMKSRIILGITLILTTSVPWKLSSQPFIYGYSNTFTLGEPMIETTNIFGYSGNFTLGTPIKEVPNIFGYSGVFGMNTQGQYIKGYSGVFVLNTKGGHIYGQITDNLTGLPIQGAIVKTMQYTSQPTGQDGVYHLWVPYGYGYQIEFFCIGYAPVQVNNIHVPVTSPEKNVNAQLISISNAFLNYRIKPLLLAPNPDTLDVPEGGTGYAWFQLEGETAIGDWLPVPSSLIQIVDEQGNFVFDKNGDPIKSDFLFYDFLPSAYHLPDAGVFGVPIKTTIIQDGSVGSQEVFTIVGANNQAILPENQQSFIARVVPYSYTQSWGFRVYSKVGIGTGTAATAGIVKGNEFIGGGSGSTIVLNLDGLDQNPSWSDFQVHRKDDIFMGGEIRIGTPNLLNTNFGAGVNAKLTASFPYQKEYKFNLNNLEELEAALAFYLYYEPSILYLGITSPGFPAGQIGVIFLSCLVQSLIENSAQNGLGIAHVADEVGLDVEGSINLEVGFSPGDPKSLNLFLGPSVGINAHFGGSNRIINGDTTYSKLYVGGGYDGKIKLGLKKIDAFDARTKFFYPSLYDNKSSIPQKMDIEYSCMHKFANNNWKSSMLEGSLESENSKLNFYNLTGTTQKYSAWMEFEDNSVKNIYQTYSDLASAALNIGKSAVQAAIDDNSFNQDFSNFLKAVYSEQKEDNTSVLLKYGFDATCKEETSIDLTLQFPLPVFPPLDIVVGGGYEHTQERNYKLANGFWVKGHPYLQTEMPNPPEPQVTFNDVLTELWQNVLSGDLYGEIKDVILAQMPDNKFFKWLFSESDLQIVSLNGKGSKLEIRQNSIPSTIDSVFCRQWDWGEQPTNDLSDADKIDQYKHYVKALRGIREEAVGMHYGIGGFYRFEPAWDAFGDSTKLTIVYADEELEGIEETSLSMYWEDTLGHWHPVESFIEPDSNSVSAWIEHFTTYTLAPRMPHGNYSLLTQPDSIPSDGFSTAMVTSPLLLNNDSTQIAENTLFTIEVSRGSILTEDFEPTIEGIQIPVENGLIEFEIRSDSVAMPLYLYAKSISGYAKCEGELKLFDTIPPMPPTNVTLVADNQSVHLNWDQVNQPDIAGYKIYFDTDSPNPPYQGIATVWGEASPVNVGNTGHHQVMGLFNDTTYFFAVTAFDIAGNESDYSMVIQGMPFDIVIHRIELSQGWSGLSSYVNPVSENTEMMFEDILDDLVILQNPSGMFWPAQNINTLDTWNTHEGYQIKVANAVDLTISGLQENNKTLQLAAGWNLIPVISECQADAVSLFTGKPLIIAKEVAGWNMYWPEYGINTLEVLDPGKAYFVMMSADDSVTYPDCQAGMKSWMNPSAKKVIEDAQYRKLLIENNISPTAITHTIALPVSVFNKYSNGDQIIALDESGNCFGLTILNTENTSMTLFGDDPVTPEKDGFSEHETITFRMKTQESTITQELADVVFDSSLPQHDGLFYGNGLSSVTDFRLKTALEGFGDGNEISIYPNPTGSLLYLQVKTVGNLTFVITNMFGQQILKGKAVEKTTEIDLSSLAPGVYTILVFDESRQLVKQIIKE